MSNVYPEQQTFLVPNTDKKSNSSVGWIAAFIIFLAIAIGLGIWLLILYLGGHVGCDSDRVVSLQGASITAEANSITGTWGTLNKETDKVTLYISEKPFVFNDGGQVVNVNSSVQQDFQVGSNGKIDISVKNNTSYNAMMIVTGDDTVNYRIFGPKKVFTQVEANITGRLFNIRDLTSCNGSVSNTATYTTITNNVGTYRLGASTSSNADSRSLLLRFDQDQEIETEQVLCRVPTATQLTQVSFGYWVNRNENAKPVVCTQPNTDNEDLDATMCNNGTSIAIENCQWSYNADPSSPNMAGLNQWCLASLGTTTINSNIQEPLCLARNGPNLRVVNGQTNTDTWFNSLVTPTLIPLN